MAADTANRLSPGLHDFFTPEKVGCTATRSIRAHACMEVAMTAAHTIATPPPLGPSGRLGERLVQMHRQWLHDLREAVDKVEEKDSGIWGRWNAIRYVDTIFSEQFDRER